MESTQSERVGGPQTRQRVIEAAETLFSERGFRGTSVREITAEAGVNLAAVNYHFGGKEGLYREVLTQRLRALREERVDAIRAAGRGGASASLEQVIDAYAVAVLAPIADPARGGALVRLMIREFVERRLPETLCCELMQPVDEALAEALVRAMPGLRESDAALAVASINAQLFHVVQMVHFHGTFETQEALGRPLAEVRRHIVLFSAAGVRAKAGDNPR